MNQLYWSRLLVALILCAGTFLRLWDLNNVPPHLRNDEAAYGYNAYSLLLTGKDEYGESFPLIFKSFGDWKPGLYIYFTIPFVYFLGNTDVAVRLPSVLAGIVAIWLIYLITNELFKNKRLALIVAFFWTISPVYIALSRGIASLAMAFALGGLYFFLKAFNKKSLFLIPSAFLFGLTLLTYHGAKLSTPLLVGILIALFAKKIFSLDRRVIIASFLIILVVSLPAMVAIFQGKAARISTLSILSSANIQQDNNRLLVYHNQGLDLIRSITSHWFDHYSPEVLFLRGDLNPQHGAPNVGAFLALDILFIILGLVKITRQGFTKQNLFIWLAILLLPLPSVLTIGYVNFERSPLMFMPWIILASLGAYQLIEHLSKERRRLILGVSFFFIFAYFLNYFYFLDQYFIHLPKKSVAWQYGYKEIVQTIAQVKEKYPTIVVQKSADQPHIFYLFYQRYDPWKYQKFSSSVFVPNQEGKDMGYVSKIENIEFKEIDWQKEKPKTGEIFVMPEDKLQQQKKFYSSFKIVKEIKDLNNLPLYWIVETI